MCFTDDDELADIIQSLRNHGKGGHKYDNVRVGINGRLDTLQAAILKAKFEVFPKEVTLRQNVAKLYNELLSSSPPVEDTIKKPLIQKNFLSVWAQYSLLSKNAHHRAEIQEKLKAAGIPSAIYYPRPLHLQTAFADLNYKEGDFPVSENFSSRIFSLPMHPYLEAEDQQKIANVISSMGR